MSKVPIKKMVARTDGMSGWRGIHVGMIACHRDKKRHAQWRWGMKKGLGAPAVSSTNN